LWTYKIPDIGQVHKPFDRVVEYRGYMFGIEEKQVREKRFYFKNISPHQMNELLQIKYGYFLINFRYKGFNKAILISASDLNKYISTGKKSIDFQTLILLKNVRVITWANKKWNLVDAIKYIVEKEKENA